MSRPFVSRVSSVPCVTAARLAALVAPGIVSLLGVGIGLTACGGGHPSPSKSASPEPAETSPPAVGPEADARRVGTSLRPDLRACYETALKKDAKLEGSVKLSVKVDPQGDVTSVAPSGGTTLDPELVDCLSKRIERAHFASPGPSGATIEIPMSFKKEGP